MTEPVSAAVAQLEDALARYERLLRAVLALVDDAYDNDIDHIPTLDLIEALESA